MLRRISVPIFLLSLLTVLVAVPAAYGQKKLWSDRVIATNQFLQQHMWNPATGNFVRRADQAKAPGSDAWGITIMLDAYAYMVDQGFMKPQELKQYLLSSSALYEKTNGNVGARIIARQGSQIYVGGDDEMQWIAALMHCYEVTRDADYLNTARYAFNALIDLGFWKDGASKGWAWNSADERPNGVSTAYGALAAARLFKATNDHVFKQWAAVALNALRTPQVGFFPRDMMVAANAATTIFRANKQKEYLDRAEELANLAGKQVDQILSGSRTGERNPTDVGDLAEAYFILGALTHNTAYSARANKLISFFIGSRSTEDIAEHGFYSRYDTKGKPDLTGSYLGVPLSVAYLPEVAEMLKLTTLAYKFAAE